MNKQQRMINTEYYEYTNVNPKNKFGGDCVVRAIALATGQTWEQTVREMTELGIKLGFVLNDKHVWTKYLESKGFKCAGEPRDINNRKMSVREWMQAKQIHSESIIVAITQGHHVTCIKNCKIRDIWNTEDMTIHRFWYKTGTDFKPQEKLTVKRRFTL